MKIYGEGNKVLGNASITMFDNWSDHRPSIRQYAIFHEVGHNIGSKLDLDESQKWLDIGGWRERPARNISNGLSRAEEVAISLNGGMVWDSDGRGGFVSGYSEGNPSEDFAESVAAYRYNPHGLLRESPEKYEFIRDVVFGGIEYLSEQMCSDRQPSYLSLLEDKAWEPEFNREETFQINKGCAGEHLGFLMSGSDSEKTDALRECLNEKGATIFLENATKDSSSPQQVRAAMVHYLKNDQDSFKRLRLNYSKMVRSYKENLRHFLLNFMRLVDADSFTLGAFDVIPIPKFLKKPNKIEKVKTVCSESNIQYAWQKVRVMSPDQTHALVPEGEESSSFAFANREALKDIAGSICKIAYRRKTDFKNLTEEQISEAVNIFLGVGG